MEVPCMGEPHPVHVKEPPHVRWCSVRWCKSFCRELVIHFKSPGWRIGEPLSRISHMVIYIIHPDGLYRPLRGDIPFRVANYKTGMRQVFRPGE